MQCFIEFAASSVVSTGVHVRAFIFFWLSLAFFLLCCKLLLCFFVSLACCGSFLDVWVLDKVNPWRRWGSEKNFGPLGICGCAFWDEAPPRCLGGSNRCSLVILDLEAP